MNVLVDYQGKWGLGDLLCSDPMISGLVERYGPDTHIYVQGPCGNVRHNPLVRGVAEPGQRFDHVVEVKLFTHMPRDEYARLEAMPSLIDHMSSYAGVTPQDRRPKLYLEPGDLDVLQHLPTSNRPRIAICADHVDPLRHWPVANWHVVAESLQAAGAEVIGIGKQERLPVGTDFVGKLSMRQTAALLSGCTLFVGNNSGPFHYAQAAGVPCVTLFSLANPQRFIHPDAVVHVVRADGLPCLECMTRCFTAMIDNDCIAAPRGRCMTDIEVETVLDAIDRALRAQAMPQPIAATVS